LLGAYGVRYWGSLLQYYVSISALQGRRETPTILLCKAEPWAEGGSRPSISREVFLAGRRRDLRRTCGEL